MRSWISLLLLIVITSCNKPEKEKVVNTHPSLTFVLTDIDNGTRNWVASDVFMQRSDTAMNLIATNSIGEKLSIFFYDTDTANVTFSFHENNTAQFTRVKGEEDSTYSTKKSDIANGVLRVIEIDPGMSTVRGDFQIRPHLSRNNYVWLMNGKFEDVPYFSVPLTDGEIEALGVIDTIDIPDTLGLACPDSTSPCIAFYLNEQAIYIDEENIDIAKIEHDRLVIKANYTGTDTLIIGLTTNIGFGVQTEYNVGKQNNGKAFITRSPTPYIANSGFVVFDMETDSTANGGFNIELQENSVAADKVILSEGIIQNVKIKTKPYQLAASAQFGASIDNFSYTCDSAVVTTGEDINIFAKSKVSPEAFELIFPTGLSQTTYNISDSIKVNYTNFYGRKNKAVSGFIDIDYHNPNTRIISGVFSTELYDFSELETNSVVGWFNVKY